MKQLVLAGRPNAGKSSIFNRLTDKKNRAIVMDVPGTTIDYRKEYSDLLEAELIDTAGLTKALRFADLTQKQTFNLMTSASGVIYMIDGTDGIQDEDFEYVMILKKIRSDLPFVLLVNKADSKAFIEINEDKLRRLNVGEPILFSVPQSIGLLELIHAVRALPEPIEEDIIEDTETKRFNLSIIGRPNAGKSTLLNNLLGEERAITSSIPGTTRDSIAVEVDFGGYKINLCDTAGVRRNKSDYQEVEKLSVSSAYISVQFSDVVIYLIDGEKGFERQDMIMAKHVLREGRALLVAVNKWDIVADKKAMFDGLKKICERYLCQARLLPISALSNPDTKKLLRAAIDLHHKWTLRTKTSYLNGVLGALTEARAPRSTDSARKVKLKFIVQTGSKPPQFSIQANRPELLEEGYQRYIVNGMRKKFNFLGIPIRIEFVAGKNPYNDKKHSTVRFK